MPRIRRIEIKKVNADGSLDLGSDKNKNAWKSDFVLWRIKNNSGVKAITKIELKPKTDNVFVTMPFENGPEWSSQINSSVREGMECSYSIYWMDENGREREHDPIITIRPTPFSGDIDVESALGIIAGSTLGAASTFLMEGSAFVERAAALIAGAIIGGIAGWLLLRKR